MFSAIEETWFIGWKWLLSKENIINYKDENELCQSFRKEIILQWDTMSHILEWIP